MDNDVFAAVMPIVCADLVSYIAEKRELPEKDAIEILYSSELYALLEQENTKVWYYSTPMLYSLLEEEIKTGKINFPDV